MSTSFVVESIIGVLTVVATWLIGNKSVWGQRISVVNNIGWWIYIVAFQHWGLVPMEVFLTVVVVRNWIKWEKEAK
jgi:hypothetical protein